MNIGTMIKEQRLARKMTQKELANLAGVAEISIRQYEAGNRQPKLTQLRKLADALNVPVAGLIDLVEYSKEESEKITKEYGYATRVLPSYTYDKLLDRFDSLNEKGQDLAIQQVELITKIPEFKKGYIE